MTPPSAEFLNENIKSLNNPPFIPSCLPPPPPPATAYYPSLFTLPSIPILPFRIRIIRYDCLLLVMIGFAVISCGSYCSL